MRTPSQKSRHPRPANDNARPRKPLRVQMRIAQNLPIQMVEVEVFAQLLDALRGSAANDNEEPRE